ncbi:MAG: serine/threonine protein kinase [Acidobacteria bacterium]|nr:serine/threonine protein kinase [Acidobacteriota bacterium]
MYCPKCNQTFEEGSRRFCPTDGVRLVSDSADSSEVRGGGIFSNLIPKIDAISDLKEPSRKPGSTPAKSSQAERQPHIPADNREPSLPDILLAPKHDAAAPAPEAEPVPPSRPTARKVNPYEIPAGHVDLANAERPLPPGADFDPRDPESFVGRIVKGRYKIVEFLGGDETGVSYIADDQIVSDKLVLVRILPESGLDEMMKTILTEERVALSHFSHPNVARLIDSGAFTNGIQYLITEFTDALSIRDVLSIHGRLDLERVGRIIRQAANGLSEAHQEGILHRDIRPENIIITSEHETDQVKLVNFGASDGTPNEFNIQYKAQEVLEGRTATAASDVFSLAAVAFEMLTGEVPFKGRTAKEVSRGHAVGLLKKPSDLRAEFGTGVDQVLSKALALDPALRYTKAREFGDAIVSALDEVSHAEEVPLGRVRPPRSPAAASDEERKTAAAQTVKLVPAVPPASKAEPAWKARSPEPPEVTNSRTKLIGGISLVALVLMLLAGWWWVRTHPAEPTNLATTANNDANDRPTITSDIEVPPLPRKIQQPMNTEFYQNTKANLRGDLLRHFVGFSIYYPKDWKVNGPAPGADANSRGKFLDISRVAPDGRMKEQMLISYYPSKGTMKDDADKFPQMVKETNETLKKILPGYQMVSEGEIKVNGDWRAYEVKFLAEGSSGSGGKLVVWGRRLFMPAARPGVQNGFEITMLATSLADEVKSVDDVGVHGELAAVLYSFEPSQDF